MPVIVERVELPSPAPGTGRHLAVHRFGRRGARPKAYLQAGLHADEPPGMIVLAHLTERLAELDRRGDVTGEITVVPVANPIGLGQTVAGYPTGRYDLALMTNFNRGWPDLAEPAAARLLDRLGPDGAANVAAVRAVLAGLADELSAEDENAALRRALLREAVDADLVLDLHCDSEAVTHLYLGTPLWPGAEDLARDTGALATLLAEVSGGHPFDEALSGPWWALARRFPDHPLPPACLAATIEYRGFLDVGGRDARGDAEGLLRFLTRRGLVAGDPGPLPPLKADASPLAGVAMVRSPMAGVVDYAAEPGMLVAAGDLLATVIDPMLPAGEGEAARREVRSPVAGVLFAREAFRVARPGAVLCKVAGAEPLEGRGGHLLTD